MPAINKIYIGNRPVESIFVGERLVKLGTGTNASSGELVLSNMSTITNPVDSIVPKIPQSNFKTTSSSNLALLGSLGFDTSILTATISIPCDGLPTKKDIVDQFNKIAQLPAKLKQQLVERGEQMEAQVREQIEGLIKDIEDLMEMFSDVLAPYWEKGKIRNWQKEAKDTWDELIQEFHIFIPVKMLEMISKLIPIDFNVNILGIDIDLLKIFTAEEQLRIKTQIIEMAPTLPEPYDKLFNGEFGTKCDEWRAKYTWQYIKNEIIQWCTNLVWKAFGALIDKFKKIWKALGLPDLPALLDFDVEAFIKQQIESFKQQALDKVNSLKAQVEQLQSDISNFEANAIAKVESVQADAQAKLEQLQKDIQNFSVNGYIIEQLEKVEIFGKSLLDIIGGKIDENVLNGEELIADLMRQAKEWFAQWQKELINQWIRKIKKFLDKIGLGKLLDLLDLDFCDVLKLIGIPTTFTLSV